MTIPSDRTAKPADPSADPGQKAAFWVFGYGSLMWNPGFAYLDRRQALISGYARRFCLWSVRYRGTPAAPGLVLGLTADAGAATQGVAFAVGQDQAEAVLAYLRDREMVTDAYREAREPVRFLCRPESPLRGAETVTYVIDASHAQFAGDLTLDEQAAIIARSAGPSGPNAEYLFNTVAALRQEGVADAELEALEDLVRGRMAENAG